MEPTIAAGAPHRDRQVPVRQAGIAQGVVLSLVTFLPILATLSVAPAIPRLIQHFAHVSNANVLVPLLLSVPLMFLAITSLFVGIPIRRFGRKPVLLAGVTIYGIFGLAPFFMEDLHAILITRAGVGIGEAMLVTVGKTLIGDYFTGERRQRWAGYQNAIDAALGTSMWFIGGLLATFGWRSPFLLYLVAIPLLLAVIFLIWEPAPSDEDRVESAAKAEATPFPWRRMAVVYGVTLFTYMMYFTYPTNIARALTELGVATPFMIGVLTAIASIGTPLGSIFISRSTSLSIATMIGLGLGFIGVPLVGIALSGHPHVATGIAFFQQFGSGILGAVFTLWCIRSLPFEHRGQGMGIWGTFLAAGFFMSPLLFAFVERLTGTVQGGMLVIGSIAAIAALVVPVIVRRTMPAEILAAPSQTGHTKNGSVT